MSSRKKIFTRTVWMVSLVSLFTDISSEMLYPVMPSYLASIGFSALLTGSLEGFADAVVGLSKGYFGKWSDNSRRRIPFIRWGYLLSALSKPMMGLLTFPGWIFSARSMDRLGKGLRTAARDAMLSEEAAPEDKGKVFGFHRGMDTLGAVLGPLAAITYLYFHPGEYRIMFFLAFVPAILGVSLTLLIKDKTPSGEIPAMPRNPFSYFKYWKNASPSYRKIIAGFLAFSLINSSDIFILIMAKHAGLSDIQTIGGYILYNFVYAIASYPAGVLADKAGMKKTFIISLVLFAIVYLGFAMLNGATMFYILFSIYGIYAAGNEGISKAWIAGVVPGNETATAIGFFAGCSSLAAFMASIMAGLLWTYVTPSFPFIFSAAGAMLVVIYFWKQAK